MQKSPPRMFSLAVLRVDTSVTGFKAIGLTELSSTDYDTPGDHLKPPQEVSAYGVVVTPSPVPVCCSRRTQLLL